jgi:hypothetical protein
MSVLTSTFGASFALAVAAAGCGGHSSSAAPAADDTKVVAWKPKSGSAIMIARRTIDTLSHDPSGSRPDWVLYDPKGDQVVFAGSEAGDQRARQIAESFDVTPPPPPPAPPPSYSSYGSYGSPSSAAALLDPLAAPPPPPPPIAGITKVDDENFILDRKEVDKWLADPIEISKGARVVPSSKDGRPNGFKFYAIRPSSLYAQLGLQNGDTIHAVNGYDLSSPDKALEVYSHLRSATSLDVAITRRAKEYVLHYSIK